jgi:uncharacterized SAM-binding protein YcdF (DUF218 family)
MSNVPPIRRARRWRRIGSATAFIALASWAVSALTVVGVALRDEAAPGVLTDAIVVLGAAHYGGKPSPVLKARLDHAAALYRRGVAPRLLLTGGVGQGDVMSEAAASRRYLMRVGIPDSAMLLEHDGRTTRESLRAAAQILQPRGWTRVMLVSDPPHMLRVAILARRFGLVPLTSPTRERETAWLSYVVSESFKAPTAFVMEPGLD